jgi:hypothetical protein
MKSSDARGHLRTAAAFFRPFVINADAASGDMSSQEAAVRDQAMKEQTLRHEVKPRHLALPLG